MLTPVTEIFGENGSGKTQTSHTLAIQAQLLVSEGGLKLLDKQPPMVLYIDTENTCRPERMLEIAKAKKLKVPEKFLDNIIVQKASDSYQLYTLIQNAIHSAKELNIRLIIVDSAYSVNSGTITSSPNC